MTTFVDRYLHA